MSRQRLRVSQLVVPEGTPDGHGPVVEAGELVYGPSSSVHVQQTWLTAADGDDTLTLDTEPLPESLQVTVNREPLRPIIDYALVGQVVTLTDPLNVGDEVGDYYLTTTANPGPSVLGTPAPIISVETLPTPFYSGHRGGSWIAPENSMEAIARAVADGVDAIELDVLLSSDGQLVLMHDTTVTRTTTSSGNVSSYTAADLAAMTVDAGTWFGGGFGDLSIPTLAEVFAEYGGQVVFIIEPKTSGAATQLIADVQAAGLQESVICQSHTRSTANSFAAAGLHAALVVPTNSVASSNSGASLLGSGVDWVLVHGEDVSDANITSYLGAGVKVLPYHVHRRYRMEQLDALGVTGYMSDDPVYVSDPANYRTTSDPFDTAAYPHGHISNQMTVTEDTAPSKRGTVTGGKLVLPAQTNSNLFVLQGWAGPLADPTDYTLDVSIEWNSVGNDSTRWAGIVFSSVKDHAFADTNSGGETSLQAAYLLLLRTNGSMQLFRRAGGTSTQLGSTIATPALTAGTVADLHIEVTPTGIAVTRTDVSAPNQITSTDTTHRGEYLFFGNNAVYYSGTVGPGVSYHDATIS